jgi:murein DD-endopeptidase MepM/ murein hydrolase activator NlpD
MFQLICRCILLKFPILVLHEGGQILFDLGEGFTQSQTRTFTLCDWKNQKWSIIIALHAKKIICDFQMSFQSKRFMRKKESRLKKLKTRFVLLICLLIFCSCAWAMSIRFESESPEIKLLDCPKFCGMNTEISIEVSDQKTGLRKIWVGFRLDDKETVFYDKTFSVDLWKGKSSDKRHTFQFALDPKRHFFPDGNGTLRIAVWDYSWRNFFKGNNAYIEKIITIDTTYPKIEIMSRKHHFNQGGAGLVIYRVSEPETMNGVKVGKHFFPGMSGLFQDKLVYASLLAVSYDQGPGTEIYVQAEDLAHNQGRSPLTYNIRKKRFKRDIIRITDRFLRKKMPEFSNYSDSDNRLINQFLKVNQQERLSNVKKFQSVCHESKNVLFWKDTFLRLPKSATRAGFGDRRTYHYQSKVVDHQVHLGIDLASTYHSPVPAANDGIVVFADQVGIFGRSVIIDHGFGLFSLYSHLNRFMVEPGNEVRKGNIIGHTGTTGLAGGDHLHFSIIVKGIFTNPLEWWDRNWIKYNIMDKIESAKDLIKNGL